MRRSSLFAPLLLIGVGALFLARNIYPDLPLLDYMAKYWPFVLILWGVLRVVEILAWNASGKPLPARGIAGGEWALVFLLVFFGGTLHAARGFYTWLPRNRVQIGGLDMFGESYDYPLAGEKAVSKTPRIVIEGFRGNARVIGGDADSIKVSGHQSIRSLDQSGAEKANGEAKFELSGDQNVVVIRTNQDHVSGNQRVTADMDITVPRGASIEAHGRDGDFDINGINGSVDLSSDSASVRVENVAGEVRVDLRSSSSIRAANLKNTFELKGRGRDIDLENIDGQVSIDGSYTGIIEFKNLSKPLRFKGPNTELEVQRLPGQIHMPLGDLTANNIVGPARLVTRSRDVQITNFTNSLEIAVDNGDIDLIPGSLPLPKMDVKTKSGRIELALPPGAKFDMNASAGRGNITNDFGEPLREESNGKRGTALRGSNGGPSITLRADRGDVKIRTASPGDAAVPPVPPSVPNPPKLPKELKRIDQ